jgi:hypothetical protein
LTPAGRLYSRKGLCFLGRIALPFHAEYAFDSPGGEAVLKVSIALLLACFLLTAVAQTQKESAPPAPEVKIGDLAPDFTLVDQNGKPRSLHDYKGKKNVALAFYVWAFSSD